MRIQEYASPRPHVVIDDVLAQTDLEAFVEDLRALEPRMTVGMVRKRAGFMKSKEKDNRVLFIDDEDDDVHAQAVMETLRAHAWADEVLDFLETTDAPLFQVLQYTQPPSVQISRYVRDGHYDFHKDIGNKTNLTVLFFACAEPKGFTGGDFEMEHGGERKTLEYRSNRLLIFPSSTLHRVTPVEAEDDHFEHARFSLQIWPAIAPGNTEGPRAMQLLRREDQARHPLKPSFAVTEAQERGSAAFYEALFSDRILPLDELQLGNFGLLGGRLYSNLKFLAGTLYPDGKFRPYFHNETRPTVRTSMYVSSDRENGEGIDLGYRIHPVEGFGTIRAEIFVRLHLADDTIERAAAISLEAEGDQLEEELTALVEECTSQAPHVLASLAFLTRT